MLRFVNDYSEGAHPRLLERLIETNMEQVSGYGSDRFSQSAKEKIKAACQCPQAEVYFLAGGTQTNMTVISSVLKPFEGVLSASSGHIAAHEAGTIEYHGHKVLEVPSANGKIIPEQLEQVLATFWADESHDHMVFPGMIYLSHPTEYGTLYTLEELTEIAKTGKKYGIPLFLDGARLAYGLMAKDTDVTLPLLAQLCDVFYIGGTKAGALCGEALIFTKGNAPQHFLTSIKQHGALLAKGRLVGVQFESLFTDDLYFEIGKTGIETAQRLKSILEEKGYLFFLDSPTNQQFVILENEKMAKLKESVAFSFWEKYDDHHTVVRFATSWATKMEDVMALKDIL